MIRQFLRIFVLAGGFHFWREILELLNNVDKHRHLHLVTASTDGGFFNPGLPIQLADATFIHQGAVDNNTILARVPSGYKHVNFAPVMGIAFDPRGQEVPGESVIALMSLINYIVGDIVNEFDHAFFP
ncbi:MAG: hypothetical protein IH849_16095 [Acidobacteria bacterium]|nr:hypothetical protein [Acidobacteriota bacterium]